MNPQPVSLFATQKNYKDLSKHNTSFHCWFNARSASQSLNQRPSGIESTPRLKLAVIYCRSGNIREVLIFANFARRTKSRI